MTVKALAPAQAPGIVMTVKLQPFDSEGLETVAVEIEIPEEIAKLARARRREYARLAPPGFSVPSVEELALDHVEVVVETSE